jgi:hypothetical protein
MDIRIATRKSQDKARADKFAASWDNSEIGPAGFAKTRREPTVLTDKQRRTLDQFTELVPTERRAAFHDAVLSRLSGAPGDAAVHVAALCAADDYIENAILVEHGLISINARGCSPTAQ